ncbi:MAG: DUF1643 domain-containing protein [Erysipelotrichaceae bacterium]|jgi:hypothetical protein|nr:DUF1643 domain-containing protein [Erysipelotrichaceae bacterium]
MRLEVAEFIKKYQDDLFGDWVYAVTKDNKYRYILGHFFNNRYQNLLVCFGINPSTATPAKLDNTVSRVADTALRNGYDGWLMFSIYPERATNPDAMHQEMAPEALYNLEVIKETILCFKITEVWFAYGNLLEKRNYLPDLLLKIKKILRDTNCKSFTFCPLSKAGHPRHPLYLSKEVLSLHNKKYLDDC